jgi:hypothetical protein
MRVCEHVIGVKSDVKFVFFIESLYFPVFSAFFLFPFYNSVNSLSAIIFCVLSVSVTSRLCIYVLCCRPSTPHAMIIIITVLWCYYTVLSRLRKGIKEEGFTYYSLKSFGFILPLDRNFKALSSSS